MAQQALPETIFNDLRNELLAVAERIDAPTDIELRRLEHSIGKLATVDASGAFELRALMAVIKGDVEEAKALYEKALYLLFDEGVLGRYALTLQRAGDAKGLHALYQRHHAQIRINPKLLRTFRDSFAICGLLEAAQEVDPQMRTLGMDVVWLGQDYSPFFRTSGFTEWDMQEVVGFARNFLRTKGLRPRRIRTDCFDASSERASVVYEFDVDLPADQVIAFEEELYALLAERGFPIESSGRLTVGLTSMRAENADSRK